MLTFRHPMFAGALLGLATLAAPASAVTTVYTAQSAFLAQLGAARYTETFTGLTNPADASPQVFGSGPFAFTASAGPNNSKYHYLYLSGDTLSTNQPNYLENGVPTNEVLNIGFGAGVTAFGADFFAVDLGGARQFVDLTLKLSDGTNLQFKPTLLDTYRGFTSTVDITGFTVVISAASSYYATLDNLTVGTAAPVGSVPEPSRLALMGLGVAALWFMRRRAD
jgi:hypothetical protein